MDDTLIPLAHGYALVQVVIGAGRSVFLAFAPSGQSLGRFPSRENAEETADDDFLHGPQGALASA